MRKTLCLQINNDIIMNKLKKAAILEKNKMAAIRRHFRRGIDPYFFVLLSTSHVPSFMLLS